MKTIIKSLLKPSALEYVRDLRLTRQRRRFRDKKRYYLSCHGIDVQYSTEDFYSNMWFYPRYAYGNIHEPNLTRMLINELQSCKCFADIGANLGYFTVIAAKMLPQGHVYSFEMDQTLKTLVEKNIKLNESRNTTIISAAVGNNCGQVEYVPHPFAFAKVLANIPPSQDPFQLTLLSQKVSLDDYFLDKSLKPDLVKMDIEGAETEALNGMSKLLDNPDIRLFIEIHPAQLKQLGSSVREVIDYLLNKRFDIFSIHHRKNTDEPLVSVTQERIANLTKNTMLFCKRPST